MRHVAGKTGANLEELNKKIAWPLAKRPEFKTTYDAFRYAIADPDEDKGIEMADNVKSALLANIRRRLTPQPIKIEADVESELLHLRGHRCCERGPHRRRVQGNGGSSCHYQAHRTANVCIRPADAVAREEGRHCHAQAAIDAAKEVVEEKGGSLWSSAAGTSQLEENALANLMEKMEMENREVAGDDEDGEDK